GSHSQNPVTVLHTDPTQLEQFSEHGHPLGIVRGILQPGGMTGQLPMLVDVVVLVEVVVVLDVVVLVEVVVVLAVVVLVEVVVVLEVVDVVDVVVLVVVLVVVDVVVVAHLTFTLLPATNSRTQAAPVKVVPSPRTSRALGAVMKA